MSSVCSYVCLIPLVSSRAECIHFGVVGRPMYVSKNYEMQSKESVRIFHVVLSDVVCWICFVKVVVL